MEQTRGTGGQQSESCCAGEDDCNQACQSETVIWAARQSEGFVTAAATLRAIPLLSHWHHCNNTTVRRGEQKLQDRSFEKEKVKSSLWVLYE